MSSIPHSAPPVPGQEPRWRRLPEERPGQILDAALEVFGEHGLAAARLEDIAKRAGLSKGTIYLYFPNKEELFREMVRRTVVRQIEESEREFQATSGAATERSATFMRRYWTYIRSSQFAPLFRLIHAEIHSFPDLARFYAEEVDVARTPARWRRSSRAASSPANFAASIHGRRAHAHRAVRDARPVVHAPRLFRVRREEDGRPGARRDDRLLSPRHSTVRRRRDRTRP